MKAAPAMPERLSCNKSAQSVSGGLLAGHIFIASILMLAIGGFAVLLPRSIFDITDHFLHLALHLALRAVNLGIGIVGPLTRLAFHAALRVLHFSFDLIAIH